MELISNDQTKYVVSKDEHIAMIMLGGQAGLDSSLYIPILLAHGMDKVYVLGGRHPEIQAKINELLTNDAYQNRVISLGFEGAEFLARLSRRCHIKVMRAGGLSIMEALAMRHHPEQLILLHHSDSNAASLKCGIPWEDCNADELIDHLAQENVRVLKTCPKMIDGQLADVFHSEVADFGFESDIKG